MTRVGSQRHSKKQKKKKCDNITLFQYIFLDGDSLSTNDLRQLGKGRYKIKVTQERSYYTVNCNYLFSCTSYIN